MRCLAIPLARYLDNQITREPSHISNLSQAADFFQEHNIQQTALQFQKLEIQYSHFQKHIMLLDSAICNELYHGVTYF